MTRVRRASALVSSWQDTALVVQNYRTRRSASATPLVIELLDFCGEWRTLSEVFATFAAVPRGSLRQLLSLLVTLTFLDRTREERPPEAEPLEGWRSWSPEAAFFHFSTKDVTYGSQEDLHAELVAKAVREPQPAPVKAYPGVRRTRLTPAAPVAGLANVLLARRTWRRFGEPVSLEMRSIATLLGLTWGVQGWAQTQLGPCALKTSPSGGARHATEVYLLARAINGLAPGCYYYDPDAHELALVKRGLRASQLEAYLPGQSCYADTPAVFVMTAVFARMQWRYGFPRAYRVVLLDAGHLCQTFCLVATALGLAPFCSAALADSLIERDLGIDGVAESVIYACGVGTRPDDTTWAPWPDSADTPAVLPPRVRSSSGATTSSVRPADKGRAP